MNCVLLGVQIAKAQDCEANTGPAGRPAAAASTAPAEEVSKSYIALLQAPPNVLHHLCTLVRRGVSYMSPPHTCKCWGGMIPGGGG